MPSYILSEPYKQRVDNALATVEGMPSQQKTTLIPTRFETLQQPAGGTPIRLAYYTATSNWFVALPGDGTTTSNTQKIQFAFPTGQTSATALCVNNMAFLPLMTTNVTAANRTILVFKEAGEWRLMGARS